MQFSPLSFDDSSRAAYDGRSGLIRYVQAIRQHWLLVAALVALAVGAASITTALATPRYDATADVLINPLDSGDSTFQGMTLFRQQLDGSSVTSLAARVLDSPQVAARAYAKLGDRGHGVSFTISPLSQATIVSVRASAPSASTAALAANDYANAAVAARTALFQRELAQRIAHLQAQAASIPAGSRSGNFTYASLEQQIGSLKGFVGAGDPTLQLLTPAVAPSGAAWPRPKLSIGIALLVGLLFGIGLAVALESFNPRITREEELTLGHRLPVLARIPRLPRHVAEAYLSGRGPLPSDAWKGYRTLRAVLETAGQEGGYPKTILVTGATPGDGKTMTAINLATTLASANLRVVLVDADFHRPMAATVFRVAERRDGLVRVLAGKTSPKQALVQAPKIPGLQLLLSSHEQVSYLHLLRTERFQGMLNALLQQADVVVIDSPPVPEVAEVLAIAAAVETIIVATRLGHTRREKLSHLRELLLRRGVSALGFVVTLRERPADDTDYYYAEMNPPAPEKDGPAPAKSAPVAREPRAKAVRSAGS